MSNQYYELQSDNETVHLLTSLGLDHEAPSTSVCADVNAREDLEVCSLESAEGC